MDSAWERVAANLPTSRRAPTEKILGSTETILRVTDYPISQTAAPLVMRPGVRVRITAQRH